MFKKFILISACLLFCSSCVNLDHYDKFSLKPSDERVWYFLRNLQEALYKDPPWGAPRSMPRAPCRVEYHPSKEVRCRALSPDYLHKIMKIFEVEPKITKEKNKTTYLYDLAPKKCPILIIRKEVTEETWFDSLFAPSLTSFLFYKNGVGDCADLIRLLDYLDRSRSFIEDHPDAKQCERPKNAAVEECHIYTSDKFTLHGSSLFEELVLSPYSVEYCYKGELPYECRYRTKAQAKNSRSVKEAYEDYLAFRRRVRAAKLEEDPLYEFTMEDKNGRLLRCGRESPSQPVKCE